MIDGKVDGTVEGMVDAAKKCFEEGLPRHADGLAHAGKGECTGFGQEGHFPGSSEIRADGLGGSS